MSGNGRKAITGMPRLVVLGLLGGFLGMLVALQWNPLPFGTRRQIVAAPYRVPKIPGGTPLRLAMVHDVLHERYLRHGTAWYQRRNETARAVIAHGADSAAAPSPEYLDAMDDLAIGLERVGQFDESISILRKKLALVSPLPASAATRNIALDRTRLKNANDVDEDDLRRILSANNLPLKQHQQYTTCANLGTVLVHSAMAKALAGDPAAKATVREGLEFIERSIAINPGAHFGRETWQAIAIEHYLAAIDHPELLTKYDLIGEPLQDLPLRSRTTSYVPRHHAQVPEAELRPADRVGLRSNITRVGVDDGWAKMVLPDYTQPMPFDEPTLAIIGMWTLGGGPNPNFSLALGAIMENVGERNIAWNAYERTTELAEKWPDPAIRRQLVAYCAARQNRIAQEDPDAQAWQDAIRRQHQKELAWGLRYQKEYQDYEAAQIAAGVSIEEPHFYDAFFANRPSIASAPGLADDFAVTRTKADGADVLPCIMLGAGLAMAMAVMFPGRAATT